MFRILGVAAGIFSLVIIAQRGFDLNFGRTLLDVLEFYEGQMQTAFSLIEPFITDRLHALELWIGSLHLYAHWKHVFVLMWLYFGAQAKVAWSTGDRLTALFDAIWGGAVALIAGVAAGVVPLESASSNMLMAAFPILGVVLFGTGRTIWGATFLRDEGETWVQHFLMEGRYSLYYAVAGGLALALGLYLLDVGVVASVANPGLALLFLLVLLLAVYWVLDGARSRNGRGDTPWQKFINSHETQTGVLMLTTIAGAVGYVLAGLLTV